MHAFVPVNKQGNFNQTERNTSIMCQCANSQDSWNLLQTKTENSRAELSAPHSFRISFYLRLKICEIPSREDFLSRKYF